jgi:hypothetical protein
MDSPGCQLRILRYRLVDPLAPASEISGQIQGQSQRSGAEVRLRDGGTVTSGPFKRER